MLKIMMMTIQMHSIGIGIVPSLVPLALIRSVLGAYVATINICAGLFVNSPKNLCEGRP